MLLLVTLQDTDIITASIYALFSAINRMTAAK